MSFCFFKGYSTKLWLLRVSIFWFICLARSSKCRNKVLYWKNMCCRHEVLTCDYLLLPYCLWSLVIMQIWCRFIEIFCSFWHTVPIKCHWKKYDWKDASGIFFNHLVTSQYFKSPELPKINLRIITLTSFLILISIHRNQRLLGNDRIGLWSYHLRGPGRSIGYLRPIWNS